MKVQQPVLIVRPDSKGRTPLFHAVRNFVTKNKKAETKSINGINEINGISGINCIYSINGNIDGELWRERTMALYLLEKGANPTQRIHGSTGEWYRTICKNSIIVILNQAPYSWQQSVYSRLEILSEAVSPWQNCN